MKKILFFTGFLIAAGGLFFAFTQAFRAVERAEESLIAQVQDDWGAQLSFQEPAIRFSPFPVLQALRPRLEFVNEEFPAVTAEEAKFSFQFFPLLWGKIRLSGLEIRGASGTFWGVSLEKIDFKLKGLNPKKPAPFECRAWGKQGKKILEGKGSLIFANGEGTIWKNLGLEARLALHSFSLADNLERHLVKRISPSFQASLWDASFLVKKVKGKDSAVGEFQFGARGPEPGNSGAFPLAGKSGFVFNLENELLEFKEATLETPFGELNGAGIFNIDSGEIKETRLIGRRMILEEIIRLFPKLDSFLPLNTGFSGQSEFDLTVRGALDYLALHANWNLTPAVLTYGTVFSKPKDFPMSVNFDLILKTRSILSGDISVRIGETTVKGALVDIRLKSQEGEFTLLTNKFHLKDWPVLLTPFAGHQMSGFAKILWNSKGMLNLTVDQAGILSPSGKGIQEISGQLDVSPLNLKAKFVSLKTGDSLLQIEADIYNVNAADNVQGKIQILSPRLDPFVLLENIRALDVPFLKQSVHWSRLDKTVTQFFPKDAPLEELTLKASLKPGQVTLEELEFRWLAGSLHLNGEKNGSGKGSRWRLEVQMDRVALARYFEGRDRANEGFEGNLFFNGQFNWQGEKSEEISKTLTGRGTLSVTNGEWHSFDLIGPLKGFVGFESILDLRSASLAFHDLKTDWNYKDKRFNAENVLVHSEDFWMEGGGNLTLEGVLNSRFEVYLSNLLTERLFQSWKANEETEGKQLGPLPYLAVGTLVKPELKIDDRSAGPLLEAIRSRRFRKVLREPFKD